MIFLFYIIVSYLTLTHSYLSLSYLPLAVVNTYLYVNLRFWCPSFILNFVLLIFQFKISVQNTNIVFLYLVILFINMSVIRMIPKILQGLGKIKFSHVTVLIFQVIILSPCSFPIKFFTILFNCYSMQSCKD